MATALDVHTRLREAEDRLHLTENLITAAGVLREAGVSPDSPDCQRLFHEIVHLPDEESMRAYVLREAAAAIDGAVARHPVYRRAPPARRCEGHRTP